MHEEDLIEQRFGRAVRRERDASGLSQPELAAAVADAGGERRHPSGLARLELGQRRVALGEAVILARVLGSTVDEMLR